MPDWSDARKNAVAAMVATRAFVWEMQIRTALRCCLGRDLTANEIVERCRVEAHPDGTNILFLDNVKIATSRPLDCAPLDKPIKRR